MIGDGLEKVPARSEAVLLDSEVLEAVTVVQGLAEMFEVATETAGTQVFQSQTDELSAVLGDLQKELAVLDG